MRWGRSSAATGQKDTDQTGCSEMNVFHGVPSPRLRRPAARNSWAKALAASSRRLVTLAEGSVVAMHSASRWTPNASMAASLLYTPRAIGIDRTVIDPTRWVGRSATKGPRVMFGKSWTVFRVRGIPIRVHVSLLLFLPYIAFVSSVQYRSLARSLGIDPAASALPPIAWGIVLAVALFVSVLLHELAHSFVALQNGVRVKSITLMMLGGVSSMERDVSPSREAWMAFAGPLVSFLETPPSIMSVIDLTLTPFCSATNE